MFHTLTTPNLIGAGCVEQKHMAVNLLRRDVHGSYSSLQQAKVS